MNEVGELIDDRPTLPPLSNLLGRLSFTTKPEVLVSDAMGSYLFADIPTPSMGVTSRAI